MRPKPKNSHNRLQSQRNGLLAKVHIAKKELCLFEEDYRGILRREFGVTSASALSIGELQSLVRYFESKGWRSKKPESGGPKPEGQIKALREKAWAMAGELDNGEKRLRALCMKICGVERIEWCNDTGQLKRLLAVLGKIMEGS